MARRGDTARQEVTNKIIGAFPGSFVQDKKIYVNVSENGEAIQFAISLTMPKTPIDGPSNVEAGDYDFSNPTAKPVIPIAKEISAEDDAKVTALMERLGIK